MALTCVTLQQRAQTQKPLNYEVKMKKWEWVIIVSALHTHLLFMDECLHRFIHSFHQKSYLNGAAISAATWSFCLLHADVLLCESQIFLQCTRGQIEMRVSRAASLFWAASPSTWIRICVDKQKQHHLLTDSRRSSVWSAVKELEHTGLSAGCVDGLHT